jgi:hypothetical protein
MTKDDNHTDDEIPDDPSDGEPADPNPTRLAEPVGNKMPPASKRFRKGVSGNPKGRPKKKSGKSAKVRSRAEIAKAVLLEKHTVMIGGVEHTLTTAELVIHTLRELALSGNVAVARLSDKVREELAPDPGPNVGCLVVPGRLKREAWERLFGKKQPSEDLSE